MKTLLILLLFFTETNDDVAINHLRNLYAQAANDKAKAKQLIDITQYDKINTVVKGYCGAGKIIAAKYYLNPFSRLNSFNQGREILESAIKSDFSNPELRYLRLTIQINSPSFLGYDKNIEQDKLFLKDCLPALEDAQLKSMIKLFIETI